MKPGAMTEMLDEICRNVLPKLLHDKESPWRTVHVTYESPRVERVWLQVGEFRVSLHRIHPCETPFVHPHPWPSAVRILQGSYQMGVGQYGADVSAHPNAIREPTQAIFSAAPYATEGNPQSVQSVDSERTGPEVATVLLTAGSSYEMMHPRGWHYVRPVGAPSLSVMLTGKPFLEAPGIPRPGRGQNEPLSEDQKNEILDLFRKMMPRDDDIFGTIFGLDSQTPERVSPRAQAQHTFPDDVKANWSEFQKRGPNNPHLTRCTETLRSANAMEVIFKALSATVVSVVWCPSPLVREWLFDLVEGECPRAGLQDWLFEDVAPPSLRVTSAEAALAKEDIVLLVPDDEREAVLALEANQGKLLHRANPIVLFLLRDGEGVSALANDAPCLRSLIGGNFADPEARAEVLSLTIPECKGCRNDA